LTPTSSTSMVLPSSSGENRQQQQQQQSMELVSDQMGELQARLRAHRKLSELMDQLGITPNDMDFDSARARQESERASAGAPAGRPLATAQAQRGWSDRLLGLMPETLRHLIRDHFWS